MNRYRRWLVFALLAGVVPAVFAAPVRLWTVSPSGTSPSPARSPIPAGARYVTDRLVVQFDSTTDRESRATAIKRAGAVVDRELRGVPDVSVVRLEAGDSVPAAKRRFERRPDVLYAEPDYLLRAHDTIPGETDFGLQWALHNTGQQVPPPPDPQGVMGMVDADIDAPEAWDLTTGTTGSPAVVVAVIDTGVAWNHPDLATNIWANEGETHVLPDGIDNDNNGYVDDVRGWDFGHAGTNSDPTDNDPMDTHGHGTAVASLIAARGNNDPPGQGNKDTVGVTWQTKIMPLRIGDNPVAFPSTEIADAIAYARVNGAQIINLSLGDPVDSTPVRQAIAASPDVLFVTSAGNDNVNGSGNRDTNPMYPCNYDLPNISLICVGASNSLDQFLASSGFGTGSVHLAAPGNDNLAIGALHEVLFDDFTHPIGGRWIQGGTQSLWGLTGEHVISPPATLTDAPNAGYAINANTWVRRQLNLSGFKACAVRFVFRSHLAAGDSFFAELSTNPNAPDSGWTELHSTSGFVDAFTVHKNLDTPARAAFLGQSQVHLRFRLKADGSSVGDGDGVYIDDLRILCRPGVPPTPPNLPGNAKSYDATDYVFFDGTSAAAPHVSGVAALLLAKYPGLTAPDLKEKILGGVDVKPAFTGKVSTGGRLNAREALDFNLPPVANAGPNQSVPKNSSVTLDASGSHDPEDDTLTYVWAQVSGPIVELTNEDTAVASFTAPSSANVTLMFEVTVTDPLNESHTDQVTVTTTK